MKMPVSEESVTEPVNFRQKYRNLKRKLKFLIYENECFREELKKAQRKLLKASRDKSFLLDRLLQYERVDESSSDSDATVSSDSYIEAHKVETVTTKKKKLNSSAAEAALLCSLGYASFTSNPAGLNTESAPKRKKTTPKIPKVKPAPSTTEPAPTIHGDGHMTSEEIERHLESRQSLLDLLPERAPLTVPTEMFSNDPSSLDRYFQDSNSWSEANDATGGDSSPSNIGDGFGDEDSLVIDLPE